MAYVIFDLDGTVIDSNHRKATLADGSLDLVHWIENNTPEKIAQDSLLPLAKIMRNFYNGGPTVIICTARIIQQADIDFLANNNLPYHTLLSRSIEHDGISDGDLKVALLEEYFWNEGFNSVKDAKAIMFDDNLHVIEAVTSIGVDCMDATAINKELAA